MTLTTTPSGNVLGNGGAAIYYSKQAIRDAIDIVSTGDHVLHVIAWYE
jgi:hypothetical protein